MNLGKISKKNDKSWNIWHFSQEHFKWLEMPYFHQMEATSSIFYKLESFPVSST